MKPRFTHDCPECVFLLRHRDHDIYLCGRTFVARYGDDGPQYLSGDPDWFVRFCKRGF